MGNGTVARAVAPCPDCEGRGLAPAPRYVTSPGNGPRGGAAGATAGAHAAQGDAQGDPFTRPRRGERAHGTGLNVQML